MPCDPIITTSIVMFNTHLAIDLQILLLPCQLLPASTCGN